MASCSAYACGFHKADPFPLPPMQDYNDEIRQAQLQELTYLNGGSENADVPVVRGKSALRTRGVPAPTISRWAQRADGPWLWLAEGGAIAVLMLPFPGDGSASVPGFPFIAASVLPHPTQPSLPAPIQSEGPSSVRSDVLPPGLTSLSGFPCSWKKAHTSDVRSRHLALPHPIFPPAPSHSGHTGPKPFCSSNGPGCLLPSPLHSVPSGSACSPGVQLLLLALHSPPTEPPPMAVPGPALLTAPCLGCSVAFTEWNLPLYLFTFHW